MLMHRHQANPSSPDQPWSLILYADEVTPGAVLAARNWRKFWALYLSFKEFGPLTLSNEKAWFTVVTKESKRVAQASAGFSQVFKTVLKDLFCGGVDSRLAGILLRVLGGVQIRLFVDVRIFVLDGDAHRILWCSKGEDGMKPCMLCANLYTRSSGITDEDGTELLTCSVVHESELVFATDNTVIATVDRLAARKNVDSSAVFLKRQQIVGFNHEPHGCLLAPELRGLLRPVTQYCNDPQHTLFVSGVFNTIVYLFFETLWMGGMKNIYEVFQQFLSDWSWPASAGTQKGIHDIFSKYRVDSWRKSKHLKCSAGECLALYPIMAYFVQRVVLPRWPNQCHAFLCMANMLDMFMCIPFGEVTPDQLRSRIRLFFDAALQAGWREFFHPKFHRLVHMPKHLEQFGWLPSCWVLERKHKVPKAWATDCHNNVSFDRTVLNETLCQHLFELEDDAVFFDPIGLLAPHAASKKMNIFLGNLLQLGPAEVASIQTGASSRFGLHGICKKGYIVMLRDDRGSLQAAFTSTAMCSDSLLPC